MNTRSALLLVLKIIVLTILLFACWSAAALVVGLADSSQPASQAGVMTAMLSMCALHAVVISYPIIRSRWSGWQLVLTILVSCHTCNVATNTVNFLHNQPRRLGYEEIHRDTC